MQNTVITPQQRENLRSHLIRRIGRMDDEALLHFEQITRRSTAKPTAEAEGSPPTSETPAGGAAAEVVENKIEEQGSSEGQKKGIDRRQAISYTVTGALALLAASTGIGWGKSLREGEALRAEGEAQRAQAAETAADLQGKLDALREEFEGLKDDGFDASLRYTLNEMNAELNELASLTDDLAAKRDASAQVIGQYQTDMLPKAKASVQQLKAMTDWMRELSADPYMFEALDVLVHMLEVKDLKSYFDFFKAYSLQIPALRGYLDNVPKFFEVNDQTVDALGPWLSEDSGIDAQLLKPMEEQMFRAFDAASRQVKSVQRLSETKLTAAVEQFLEKRDQFYNALEES